MKARPFYFGGWLRSLIPGAATLLFATVVHSQILREDSVLFDKPDGAQTTNKLKTGTAIKPLKRQGFWVQVDAGGKTGWLKVSAVSFGGATSAPVAIDSGRLGTGNIVSTSASRGLSAKDLLEGKPNFAEVAKLEKLAADGDAVQTFLSRGSLIPATQKIALSAAKAAAPITAANSGQEAAPTGAPAGASSKKKSGDDW